MSTPQDRYWEPAPQITRLIVAALDYQDFGLIRGMVSAETVDFTTIELEHEEGRFRITVEEQR